MSNSRAIKGTVIPENYRQMGTTRCGKCNVVFSIIHYQVFADEQLVQEQGLKIRSVLTDEHVDEKFVAHLPSYDLDDLL